MSENILERAEEIKADVRNCSENRCQSCSREKLHRANCYDELSKDALHLIKALQSELEAVKRERDAAVEVIDGFMKVGYEAVKPRISLRPFRTFTEVEQPESEFILRITDDGGVALIEADGGAWKMEAKAHIASYFETCLAKEVEAGAVVVMM